MRYGEFDPAPGRRLLADRTNYGEYAVLDTIGHAGIGGFGKGIVVGAVSKATSSRVLSMASIAIRSRSACFLSTSGADAARFAARTLGARVDHWHGDYVAGAVHTNTIEGFSSMVKRGIIGTFHKGSAKYLPVYVNELEFRYNNRSNEDIFAAAIKACWAC